MESDIPELTFLPFATSWGGEGSVVSSHIISAHSQQCYRFVLKIACDDHIVCNQHMLILFFHSKLIIFI